MTGRDTKQLATHLRAITQVASPAGGLADAELIRRYADARDEAAFEVLVWRHGPMVLGTCYRVLRHRQDAEDAFQATFLALARSARVVGRDSVAGWLHRVASNAALKVKARRRPTGGLTPDVPGAAPGDPADREFAGALDQELSRLPAHYRAAFVLCCLEGMTNAQAARELGCPVGTVDSRLHAARTRLRDRLAGRGFAPQAATGVTVLVAVPLPVSAAAIAFGTSTLTPPPAIDELAEQIGRTMSRTTVTMGITAAVLAVTVSAAAAWAFQGAPPTPPAPRPKADDAPRVGAPDKDSLRVAVHYQDGLSAESRDTPQDLRFLHNGCHLSLLVTNTTKGEIHLWKPSCPEGDDAIRLEFKRDDDSKEVGIARTSHAYTGGMGIPRTIKLVPGDSLVFRIDFSSYWSLPFVLRPGAQATLLVRAVYESKPRSPNRPQLPPGAAPNASRVWVGRVETKWERVRIANLTDSETPKGHQSVNLLE